MATTKSTAGAGDTARASSDGIAPALRALPSAAAQRPPTLVEHALETIRRAIVHGELQPGQRLREEELAEQLGISRAPVREAMRALEYEGLVRSEPHRATYVAAPSEEEIEEIYRVRAEVESIAARRAALAVAAEPARLQHYQALLDRMRHSAAQRDLYELTAADLDFHRLILDDSGYTLLPRVWAAMFGLMRGRMSIILAEQPEGEIVSYTAESHAPVVAALATGDPEQAAAAIRRHILETLELWLQVRP